MPEPRLRQHPPRRGSSSTAPARMRPRENQTSQLTARFSVRADQNAAASQLTTQPSQITAKTSLGRRIIDRLLRCRRRHKPGSGNSATFDVKLRLSVIARRALDGIDRACSALVGLLASSSPSLWQLLAPRCRRATARRAGAKAGHDAELPGLVAGDRPRVTPGCVRSRRAQRRSGAHHLYRPRHVPDRKPAAACASPPITTTMCGRRSCPTSPP